MTVQEYAEKHDISTKTVYRRIDAGKINAKKTDGIWTILETDNSSAFTGQLSRQIDQLSKQVEYLQNELSQANETLADERQRHDTIVLSLSNQVNRQQKMLEDLRERSLWVRVRTALGFASA